MPGRLYIVSTPIGNPGDVTLRAIRVLKKAVCIAAEDPARTQPLLEHYRIATPVTSYQNQNKEEKAPVLLRRMQEGEDVALVVDAGTPVISDPGAFLLERALEAGIRVRPVPGASAILAALSISGLSCEAFVFGGTLPDRPASRRKVLQALCEDPRTLALFVSAERLRAALEDVRELFGARRLALAKDLTTSAEQVFRGSAKELLEAPVWPVVGEVTLVVEGNRRRVRRKRKRKKPR